MVSKAARLKAIEARLDVLEEFLEKGILTGTKIAGQLAKHIDSVAEEVVKLGGADLRRDKETVH